ncbi:MAG: hypothetical protein K8S18_12275 [Desulfobacula sp.]|nr:hypothetical protein [Desulfobacula sp.]
MCWALLSNKSQRGQMRFFNFSNIFVIIAFFISVAIWHFKPLTSAGFLQLLVNLEGTVFLAGAISSGSNTDGLGNNFREKFEWRFIKPMKYSTTARFNPIRFYIGLFFLFLGSIIGSLQ